MAQINLGGSIGVPGSVAVLGNYNVIFTSDSDHTMSVTEFSNKFLNITSSVSLTMTHTLIAPLNQGQEFVVQNNTTGGQSIIIKGLTGTGVTIPHAGTLSVVCDGTNYMQTSGSGTFIAAGDLSGTSSSQTVVGLQGHPLTATSPTNGQILEFNSGSWNAVTLSGSGVSWTGDTGAGAGVTGSSDGVQYITSISGAQGGGTPGRIQLYGNEFRILNSVTSDFNFDWMPMTSAVEVGTTGHKIILTAQAGQVGGVSFASGVGGDIHLFAGSGVSGGGSIASNGGNIQIASGAGGSGGGVGGNIQIETGDVAQSIAITNTAGAGSNGVTITSVDNFIISNTETGSAAFLEIANTWDGYTSSLQMSSNTVLLNSAVQNGYYPYTQLQTNGNIQLQVAGPPYPTGSYPLDSFLTVVTGQTQIASSTVTIRTLAGSGSGVVGVDNNGELSWAAGTTWAGDLAGSTGAAQYVATISGPSGNGGTVNLNTDALEFYAQAPPLNPANPPLSPTITQATMANLTGAIQAQSGSIFTIQAQEGQYNPGFGTPGNGGSLYLFGGYGGHSGAGIAGPVIVGDPTQVNCDIQLNPAGFVFTTPASVPTILFSLASNNPLYMTSLGSTFQGKLEFQQFTVTTAVYTVDSSQSDYYLLCNRAGAIGIVLPPPTAGRTLVIKDASGNANSNNITITHNSGENIDGSATYIINKGYGSITLTSDGTNWFVVGSYKEP